MVTVKKARAHSGQERIYVTAPYHPAFVNGARRRHGIWHGESKHWSFDAREEAHIRTLCFDVYGTDGSEAPSILAEVPLPTPILEVDGG